MILFISIGWLYVPQIASADVEWTFGKQRNLDVSPIDISSSSDGQWIYMLTPGEIAIYSVFDDTVVNRIPIDKTFDKISYAVQSNSLVVSSSTAKTMRLIQLEVIQKFASDGLAFKGLENAPVLIAVFSDYQ
jgi:hypothetical protein